MKCLVNKVIIVAGASGGIGSATARNLARLGSHIILAARSNLTMRQLLAEVRASSPESEAFEGDLSQKNSWLELVEFVSHKFARIDGFVNCVGLLNTRAFPDLTSEEVESEIRTNVQSVLFGVQAVLPLMRKQMRGDVVTIGSLGGIVPMPYSPLYCATKHAVRGFSLSMNEEYRGSGVSFSLLSLGPVKTGMLDREARSGQSAITFVNKPLHPDRVARAVLSLLLRPRPELILPSATGALCLLSNLSPAIFSLCYHTFGRVGEFRLLRYRQMLQNTRTRYEWENEHEYIH